MAFRVTRDELLGRATLLGVARRWLRELVFEDWWLKLFALVIALGLWLGVTSQRAPASVRLPDVHLSFLLPADVEISNDPRDEVEVTLQGRKNDLDALDRRNLVATVDVSDLKLGERVVRLTPERVSMNLPEGVRIAKIEPRSVPLRLERRVEREVEVAARVEGELPEGFELRGVRVSPRVVHVRGPESHVRALDKAPTETVSLEGHRESVTLAQVAVDIADEKVVALEPVVAVRLEIAERGAERRLGGVRVRGPEGAGPIPDTVEVTVRGGRTAVESLRAEDLQVVLERGADGALQPRLLLPPNLSGKIELVGTAPRAFPAPR